MPLWGMIGSGKEAERSDRTPDRNSQSVAVTTEQNRWKVQGAEDDGPSELGSPDRFPLDSDACTSNKRHPRRQSSQQKFSSDHPPLQQQLATELTSDRKQIEEETATRRAELARSLFEKHSSLQAEQNAPEDFSDREKVYQAIEALHARQQKQLEKILEDQAQLAQERLAPKGWFSLFYSPEKKFFERENTIHQKLVALVQEKVSSFSLELEWLLSFSQKRNALIDQPKVSSSQGSLEQQQEEETVAATLQEIQEIGLQLIKELSTFSIDAIEHSKLNCLSDEQLHCMNEVIDLVRNTQLFVLGYDSSSYITMSKEQLAEIEKDLEEKIKMLNPALTEHLDIESVKVATTIRDRYLAAQELFENSKAQFLLIETTPEGETSKAASKSAKSIGEQAQEIKNEKALLELECHETAHNDQDALSLEIKMMDELHNRLLNGMLSYRQIQDEAWIEQQCANLNKLRANILEKIGAMKKNPAH